MKILSAMCGLLTLLGPCSCQKPKKSPAAEVNEPSIPPQPAERKDDAPRDSGSIPGLPTGEWNRVDTGEVYKFTRGALLPAADGKQKFDRIIGSTITYGDGAYIIDRLEDGNMLHVSHGDKEFYLIRSGIDDAEVLGSVATGADGLALAGETRIAVIADITLKNLSDDTTEISSTPNEDGKFAVQNVQSGRYSVVAKTTDGSKIAVIDDLRVERKQQKAGNISAPRTAHNFKTTIDPGAELLYEGSQYSGVIRIKNIGHGIVNGPNYRIDVPSNLEVTGKTRDILGSISPGATKEIPFTFKATNLDDDQVDFEIPITITDTRKNKWLDYVYLTVFKQTFSTYITADQKPVSGFVSYLDNKLMHFSVPAGQTTHVDVPYVYGRPYFVVLSAADLNAETKYSVGIGKAPSSNFLSFIKTGQYEPNNRAADAHDVSVGDDAMAYLFGGDVDFYRFALTRPQVNVTNLKSGDMVPNGEFVLRGTCSDDGGDIVLRLNSAEITGTKCQGKTFQASVHFTRPDSGPATVSVRHKNTYGFPSKQADFTVTVENPMTFTSLALNQGSEVTSQAQVTVDVVATGAKDIYIVNGPNCGDGGTWQPFQASTPWLLSQSNSEAVVSAKLRSPLGAISACKVTSIGVDQLPPSNSSIQIGDNLASTGSSTINLVFTAVDAHGPVSMYVTDHMGCTTGGTWEPLVPLKAWTITNLDATNTIYAKFKDGLANETECFHVSIAHDSQLAQIPTISINGGLPYTSQLSANLSLYSANAAQMYVTNSSGCGTGGTWEPYAPSRAWTLSQLNGIRSVYVKFRDMSGNESLCVSDSISYLSAPTAPVGPASPTSLSQMTFSWTNPGNALGSTQVTNYLVQIGNSPGASNVYSGIVTGLSKTINVTSSYRYYARVQAIDTFGNVSLFSPNSSEIVADSQPPTPGGSGTITATPGTQSVTLSWTPGSDDYSSGSDLQYRVYYSTDSTNMSTLSDVLYATLGLSTSAQNTSVTVTGLTNPADYTFNVVIHDQANNRAVYRPVTIRPTYALWTWISGSRWSEDTGVYGTKGVTSIYGSPGSRADSVSWTDPSGNLWLFGGYGHNYSTTGYLNDLWKFDRANSHWTWMSGTNGVNNGGSYGIKGTPSSSHYPGARDDSVSWTDSSGNLWLFGGYGYASSSSGRLNDLWKFSPSSSTWTWVSGSNTPNQAGNYGTKGTASTSHYPGARWGSVSWTDPSGNLWLFGGYGYASSSSGNLNDLWKFSPSTAQWTWVSGSNTPNQVGNYGTKGTASTSHYPGARDGSVAWMDSSGNLWLFGGSGYASSSSGNLNDLWKFSPSTAQWTWVSGSNTPNQVGNYGTKGTPSASHYPGGRNSSVSWTDPSGNLWLFGGSGYTSSGSGRLNDLWKFSPSTAQWTWVSGSNTVNQVGSYDTNRSPGARSSSASWMDPSGNLRLFGGLGYDQGYGSSQTTGNLSDFWMFTP